MRRSVVLVALTVHGGLLFTHWTPRPNRSELPVGRAQNDLAQEVQAILEELKLDEPITGSSPQPRPQASPMLRAPVDASYMSASTLRNELEAQERRKQELLEEQRRQELQLQQLRQQQQELQQHEERQWSARPPLPPGGSREIHRKQDTGAPALGKAPPLPTRSDGLLAALRHWGIRQAPELGQEMFVASLPQIKMLVRAQGDQAGRTHVAGLQALQRYVEQLEMDLDNKEEELSNTKRELREAQQQRPTEVAEGDSKALAAAQAEVARLEEELQIALQGQEEVQSQLTQQVQRAEAAEAKLVNLVERIRGHAAARAR